MHHAATSRKVFLSTIIVCLCFLCGSADAQMRQIYFDTTVSNNNINKISFYSASEGYIASTGSPNWVGYTSDSGHSFIKKPITISNVDWTGYPVNLTFGFSISGVKAFSRDTLVAYGDYGFVPAILYSTNGAATWKLIFHSQFNPNELSTGITDMVFPQNSNVGYAIDADRILKSTNRGLTWSPIRTDPHSFFDYLEATDDNNVIAFSTQYASNKLLKTTNGGTGWQQLAIPPASKRIFYSQFLTPLKGWLNIRDDDQNGQLYYTSNGGSTWTIVNDPLATSFGCTKFKFINDSTGFAIGGFEVLKTTDSGKVWERLPRDNNFSYLGFSFSDMLVFNQNQLWTGGARDFLEISTNGGGTPLPGAFFKIDTVNLYQTNTVNLLNFSKPGYQYKWFLNNTQISTSYNTSYTHNASLHDTVTLIVSNGLLSDTLTQEIFFNPPVIVTSFTPTEGVTGTTVAITGVNFSGATQVYFGGVPASFFTVVSSTRINAVVALGATGNVTVAAAGIGSGSKPGFTYYPPPNINLPITVSKNILCQGESITIAIQNSENNVRYDLLDSLNHSFGSVTGNGGTAGLFTSLISVTGNYKIKATRTNIASTATFTNAIFILVEHTHSAFSSTGINVYPGEAVNYFQRSVDASSYAWTFDGDASTTSSTLPNPQNISYTTAGQKSITLISSSANGCKDTLHSNSIFVFTPPAPSDVCYAFNLDPFNVKGHVLKHINRMNDGGFILTALDQQPPSIKSRYGMAKFINAPNTSYIAKYTTDGALRWVSYFKNGDGRFNNTTTDADGNIYVLGVAVSSAFLHLGDHDSMRIYALASDTTYIGTRSNGFILKLDPAGHYLWHSILYDPTSPYSGYPYLGSEPQKLVVKNNQVIVTGGFKGKLSYWRNGSMQSLYDFQNSTSFRDNQNNFIIKLNPDGSLVWHAYAAFSAVNDYDLADIDIDRDGNSYITGTWEIHLNVFDADSIQRVNLNGNVAYFKGFVLKFDSNGKVKWYNTVTTNYQYGSVLLNALAVDSVGSSYVTGNGQDWGLHDSLRVTHSDGSIAYDTVGGFALMKFDSTGHHQWGVGCQFPYYGGGSAVYLKGNHIYAAGTASNNGVMNSQFLFTSADLQHQNIGISETEFFIADYDLQGNLKRVSKSGVNTGGHINPADIFVDDDNNYFIGANADLYNGGTTLPTVFGNPLQIPVTGDAVIMKLNTAYCLSTNAPVADAGYDRLKCAGDTVHLGAPAIPGLTYYWRSASGNYSSTQANPVFTVSATTSFYMTVVNSNGLSARDTVVVSVTPNIVPSITINGITTVPPATPVTLTATSINGGTAAIYQWQDSTSLHSWQNISGGNSISISYTAASSGDKVRCKLTSDMLCALPNPATSNSLVFSIGITTAIDPAPGNVYNIKWFPNPVRNDLYVEDLKLSDRWETIEIVNVNGKQTLLSKSIRNQTKFNLNVEALAAGVYTLVLKSAGNVAVLKFVKL